MTRIDSRGVDYCALLAAAEAAGVKLTFRVARCQHGYTANQTCVECENGYVDDTHRFANLPEVAKIETGATIGRTHLFAISDDMETVACLTQSRYYALSHDRASVLRRVAELAALA